MFWVLGLHGHLDGHLHAAALVSSTTPITLQFGSNHCEHLREVYFQKKR